MTAYTATQTGNWSNPATWGAAGPPTSGDTATIGAFTVTVDVNTSVGTSPNDATTKVVDKTSATGSLIVATGVTFTVLGNIGGVNGSVLTLNAGSTLIFDNSGSGGSPIYTIVSAGFQKYNFNGTLGSPCVIQAIVGATFALNANWSSMIATYTTFRRCSTPGATNSAGGTAISITHCTYDTCGKIDITHNSATIDFTFTDNIDIAPTHATDSLGLTTSVAATSGVRTVSRNAMLKNFSDLAKSLIFDNNVFASINCVSVSATFSRPARNNTFIGAGTINSGNGQAMSGSWNGVYVVVENSSGNPHFISPLAKNAVDETYDRIVFESQTPDLIDVGDCFIMNASSTSGGNKAIARNCIVLKAANGAPSGTALTIFNNATAPLFDGYRITANADNSALIGTIGRRGAFAIAESGSGVADQVTNLKSNLVWAGSATAGYLGERVTGNVKDIITAAGADKNWRYNLSAGDNQRGYEDRAASNTLWTAGDAVAASVDANSGTGDPLLLDNTRNMAAWAVARGYGTTYADAKAAIYADPTRGADLINYIFEGHKVQNASMRNAAHDGGTVGAANYHKSTRTLATLSALRTAANSKYGISV